MVSCSKTNDMVLGDFNVSEGDEWIENSLSEHGLDQDRFITLKGTDIDVHYRIIGKGPKNLVFIPGWTNPLTAFTKQFDYFRDKARCIYIDPPGHGLSDAPENIEYTMALHAQAVYEILKKEGLHNGKFTALGFSMGTPVWGQFEQMYPGKIDNFVNIDGGFTPWPPEGPERDAHIAWREGFYQWILTWNDPIKQGLLGQLLGPNAPQDLIEWAQYFFHLPNWLIANEWYHLNGEEANRPPGWDIPILSIYTGSAPPQSYEQVFLPGSEVIVFEDSGHLVQWEHADEFNALIEDFIDGPGKKY